MEHSVMSSSTLPTDDGGRAMLLCIARGNGNFNKLTLGIPPETKAELKALYAVSGCLKLSVSY